MKETNRSNRLLYVGLALIAAGIMLPCSIVLVGLYYFGANEAIPPAVNTLQEMILGSARLCGAAGILLIVLHCIRAWTPVSRCERR